MKTPSVLVLLVLSLFVACNKSSKPAGSSTAPASSASSDPIQQKLQEYSGVGATDCGRINVQANADRSKAVADCAMQATQSKHPFYVAYDMPGMTVGIAGNSEGKLFSVQSQGEGAAANLTSGSCPSQLRVANSGRVTCFTPADMGGMSGHTAIPPGMPDPHAMPKVK